MIPDAVKAWLHERGHGDVTSQKPLAGGCINNGTRLETGHGASFFLKTNSSAPIDLFAREAEGLETLRKANGPRFPQPYLHGDNFILMEDLNPVPRARGYWETLGKQLAQLHGHTHAQFGFHHDNYLGSTPQLNPWTRDGFEFFAEKRLNFQARLAREKGLLEKGEVAQIDSLGQRLPGLVPQQPAVLIHGDLWSGNAISDALGQPALIDPAAHYGWAEAELGMTALFGGFSESFYTAYEEKRPLEPGWRDRLDIYNLYHLLNHINLFGRGYYRQVVEILQRYS